MKFKVGDKVRIKSLEYLKSVDDNEKCNRRYGWNDNMYNCAGKICTVSSIDGSGGFYTLKEIGFMWAEDYLEDVDNEENKKTPKYKVGDKVRVKSLEQLEQIAKKDFFGGWVEDMYEDAERVFTVKVVYPISERQGIGYEVHESAWTWDECCLEDVEENGEEVLKETYKEIFRLKEMLEISDIPFDFRQYDNFGFQIGYPEIYPKNRVVSVVEDKNSIGSCKDQLEIKGLLTKEERGGGYENVGYLTAEDVFERIQKHFYKIVD